MARSWVIRPSNLHGFGVFASQAIPGGFAIGTLDCVRFGRWQMKGEPATGVVSGPNQMAVMGGFPLWYLNYSGAPNVQVIGTDHGDTQPFIVTTRAISDGEELTISNGMGLALTEVEEQRRYFAMALADLDRLHAAMIPDRPDTLGDAIRLLRDHDRWLSEQKT